VSRRSSLAAVIVSALCFGTLAVLTPLAYAQGAEPLPLLAWRFAIAAVFLGSLALMRDRHALKVTVGDLARYSALALAGYGAASVCFFFALLYAPASVCAVLLYAYPTLITIAGWMFLGKKVTWQHGVAVVMAFVGCALVLGIGSSEAASIKWQGVVLGLGAAVGYSIFSLLSDRWLHGRSSLAMMTYTFAIATVLPTIGAVATGGIASLSVASWSPTLWGLLAAIVVVPTFAAVTLFLRGIRGLGSAQAALVATLEPIFTIVLAMFLLPEQPMMGGLQIVGVTLVLVGVVLSETGASRSDSTEAEADASRSDSTDANASSPHAS